MGYTRSYYEKLLNQKFQELYRNKVSEEGMAAITDQDLAKVLEEVKKDLDQAEPKKSQLKKTFKKFCDEQTKLKRTESPKKLAYDEKSQKLFKSGDKYEQYKKNQNAFLNSCLQGIKKEIAWDTALRSLDLKDDKGNKVQLGSVRWRNFLIKEDGSDKSRKHNEEFCALLALGTKVISPEQFIQMRKKHYTSMQGGALSAEAAEKKARDESERVGERIWEMTKEKLEETREQRKNAPIYASYILSGKAGMQGYPTVEECRRVVDNTDLVLLWELQKLSEDIAKFGGLKNENEIRKFMLDGQITGNNVSTSKEQAEIAANFYFSMLDPFKLIDREKAIDLEMPSNPKGTYDEEMRKIFSQDCYSQKNHKDALIEMAIKPFGLHMKKDQMILFPDKDPAMRVIRRETTDDQNRKIVQTAIVRLPELTDDAGPIVARTTGPEELVNDGFEKSVNGFMDTCKDWSREHRTSDQFERMRKALEKLEDKKLPYRPQKDELHELQTKLEALRDRSNEYLAYKTAQRHGGHFRYGFERKRVKLAKKMNEFAANKLKELQYVREHIETVELAKEKEKELKTDQIYQKKLQDGYEGGALGYLREKEEDAIVEQNRRLEEQRRQELAEERRAEELKEEQEKKEKRKKFFSKITEMKNGCTELSKDHDPAKEKVGRYIETEKAKRPELVAEGNNEDLKEEELEQLNQKKKDQVYHLAAGRVIERMLEDEHTELEKNPNADSTLHELVNGGKLEDLAELIVQNEYFQDTMHNRKDGSTDSSYRLIETEGSYPYYVSKSFRGDLAKAAAEQKEEAALGDNLKEEPMKEEAVKEEIKEEIKEEKESVKDEDNRIPVAGGIRGLMAEAGMNLKEHKVSHPAVSAENVINIKKDPVNAKG